MYIATDKDIETYKIDLSSYFGGQDVWIILQELPPNTYFKLTREVQQSQADQKTADIEKILGMINDSLPEILIDHNFYKDEKHKLTNKEALAIILPRGKIVTSILTDYVTRAFFSSPAEVKEPVNQ